MLGTYSEAGLRSLGLTAAINIGYSMLNRRIDNWWACVAACMAACMHACVAASCTLGAAATTCASHTGCRDRMQGLQKLQALKGTGG